MLSRSELPATITDVPALAGAVVRQVLPGGQASDSWLVEGRGRMLVVRVDTPLARTLGLDRQAELGILETVAAAGIGPDVIWADPDAGVLVTRYITEPVWDQKNIMDPACLNALAGTLKRLHGLASSGPDFDPEKAARGYAGSIGTDAAISLADRAATLTRQLLAPGHYRALCHNDLVYANIIGSNPVRLIDWEYAATGDPLFDLAVVVQHHQLPVPIAGKFLHDYMGNPGPAISERFEAFCQLYDLLSELWYLAVGRYSTFSQG